MNCDVCKAQFDPQECVDVERYHEHNPELGWRYGFMLHNHLLNEGVVCKYYSIEAANFYCRKCWNAACETVGTAAAGTKTPEDLLREIKAVARAMATMRATP